MEFAETVIKYDNTLNYALLATFVVKKLMMTHRTLKVTLLMVTLAAFMKEFKAALMMEMVMTPRAMVVMAMPFIQIRQKVSPPYYTESSILCSNSTKRLLCPLQHLGIQYSIFIPPEVLTGKFVI